MGIAKEGDVFYTAVIDDAIWAFPGPEAAAVLEQNGLALEPVDESLAGFRIMAVGGAVPPAVSPQ